MIFLTTTDTDIRIPIPIYRYRLKVSVYHYLCVYRLRSKTTVIDFSDFGTYIPEIEFRENTEES